MTPRTRSIAASFVICLICAAAWPGVFVLLCLIGGAYLTAVVVLLVVCVMLGAHAVVKRMTGRAG